MREIVEIVLLLACYPLSLVKLVITGTGVVISRRF